jgi:hypothetical protein
MAFLSILLRTIVIFKDNLYCNNGLSGKLVPWGPKNGVVGRG